MTEKSPEAFRTISEAASELDVPQHVLRFWETRFSQIRPMKRAGGRRYYRPEDVDLLKGIRALLYDEGYTIKGVQKILREKGVAHVIAIGRGEARPEIAPVDVARAILPEKARRVADARETPAPPPQETADRPASAQPVLGREELENLRQALTDLSAARRLLAQAQEGPRDTEEAG
jgi:DNA-binding transcriptional MerR regulator